MNSTIWGPKQQLLRLGWRHDTYRAEAPVLPGSLCLHMSAFTKCVNDVAVVLARGQSQCDLLRGRGTLDEIRLSLLEVSVA